MRLNEHLFILVDKDPIGVNTVEEWAAFNESKVNRVVEQTYLQGRRILVSTVFLGVNHRFFGDGPPLLFETMVFNGTIAEQRRYCTWDEAERGHWEIVQQVRLALGEAMN